MHYSLIGKMRLPFKENNWLYKGAILGRFEAVLCKPLNKYPGNTVFSYFREKLVV